MDNSIVKKLITGLFWSFGGNAINLTIALATNILMARILSPYEFGQLGIVMFFLIIANVLTESGLGGALVRKVNITEQDYSTVFIFNLGVSIFLFVLLVLISGQIAKFYNDPTIKEILIASSFVIIINAFQLVQNAKLVRDLKFKNKSFYSFLAISISSILGISLVYNGFGVWSVVLMQLCNASVLTLLYWIFENSLTQLTFSKNSFKQLYKFGINTTLASIIETLFDNIYQLVLGKYFSINQTGFYYQAKKLQEAPVGIIKSATIGVVFSALSKVQENKTEFYSLYLKIITIFTVILGLICLLIFFYSEQIINLLFGEKWLNSTFFLQVLIIASFFYMQEMFNRIIFKVFDQTDKILYLEIFKKILQTLTILAGILMCDLKILLFGFLFTSVISYFINYYYSRSISGYYSYKEFFITIKVVFSGAIISILTVYLCKYLIINSYSRFYFFPVIIIGYFVLLNLCGVINLKTEIKSFNKNYLNINQEINT